MNCYYGKMSWENSQSEAGGVVYTWMRWGHGNQCSCAWWVWLVTRRRTWGARRDRDPLAAAGCAASSYVHLGGIIRFRPARAAADQGRRPSSGSSASSDALAPSRVPCRTRAVGRAEPNRGTGTIFFLAIATEPPTGPRHVAPRTTVPSITSVVGRPRAPVSADAGLGGVQWEDGRIRRRPTTTIDIDRSTSMCRPPPFQPGGRLAPSHPITYFLVLKWTDGDWGVRSHV
jgi:hypothetical protein